MVNKIFQECNCVFVSGTYGSGKSLEVCQHLQRATATSNTSVLVVCYRQSQGLDLCGKLYHFLVPVLFYLNASAKEIQLHKERIVISTQSLSRICPIIDYDIMVLDEVTSLLLDAATSRLVPRHNFDILVHCIQTCKQLISMDVNLPSEIVHIIRELRNISGPNAHIHMPHQYANKIIFEPNFKVWNYSILEDLNMGHNVVLCSDSKKTLFDLCDQIPSHVKKRIYAQGHPYNHELENVNSVWTDFQLVAYTPAITTATSFVEPHFHTVYGYFNFSSLSARTFAQQLHRVRQIKTQNIIVHATQPKYNFLKNKKGHDLKFCTKTRDVQKQTDYINKLIDVHNNEIQITFDDFDGALTAAIKEN